MTQTSISIKEVAKPDRLIFAILKETTKGGSVNYIPVCAIKPRISLIQPQFTRILQVYGTYHLLDLDLPESLSEGEAMAHITGYKEQLRLAHNDDLATIELIQVQ